MAVADIAADLPYYGVHLFEPHRYVVFYGGRGAGRSWTVARGLLIEAAETPLRVLCARELQNSLDDSVHQLLVDQAAALGLPFTATRNEITHPNGSSFIFKGLKVDPNKIKSLEGVDRCWVEEAERVSEVSWQKLVPTIRKPGSKIIVTFNPDLESDPTYKRFVLNPPPDSCVKKVSWRDNPWLPEVLEKEKDYLYRVDPEAAAHVWGGETRQASAAQVLNGKWIVEEFDTAELGEPLHGADFGFAQDPMTAVRCYVWDNRLYISHEAYRIGLELDHVAEHWETNIPGALRYVIRADSSAPQSISHLRRHGVPAIEGAPKWAGSVEDGIRYLRQFEQIILHPRCKHAIDEARHWSYKVDARTGDVLPKLAEGNEHIWDAVRYALSPLIKQGGMPWAFSA